MQEIFGNFWKISPNKPKRCAVGSATVNPATPAREMQAWICAGVTSRRHEGAERAVRAVAREIGITPGRVTEILRGRVLRVWADEWQAAQRWYTRFCDKQAAASARQAELYAAERAALMEKINR